MAKKKYYAVKKGTNPGIYLTWDECKEQVSGFSGAEYRGFATEEEAKAYLGLEEESSKLKYNEAIAYVDGSYNKETKVYGSGIVFLSEGGCKEFSKSGNDKDMLDMWNVAGEYVQPWMQSVMQSKTIFHPLQYIMIIMELKAG